MRTLAIYVGAAAAEIAGCFALWAVVRNGASALWLAPGVLSLVLFGWLLTTRELAGILERLLRDLDALEIHARGLLGLGT